MKTRICFKGVICATTTMLIFFSCTKEEYPSDSNDLLKKVKIDGSIVEEISYNSSNLVSEVNGTSFWRKFYYNDHYQLIKEEVAMDPLRLSSTFPTNPTHEFIDPDKVGISMYRLFEYDNNNRRIKQLTYVPTDGQDELRSTITYIYDDKGLINKVLLHNSDSEVTHFRTYLYDDNGNVKEENFYSYLFIPAGTGPKHLWKTTFEYDSYFNPYKIFEQSGYPGLNTNLNNVTKSHTTNYNPSPGLEAVSASETSYEYNRRTRFPIRVINGEEFIYK